MDTDLSGQLPDPGHAGSDFASISGDLPVDNAFEHYDLRFSVDANGLALYSAVITYEVPAARAANGDVDCDDNLTARDNQAFAALPPQPAGAFADGTLPGRGRVAGAFADILPKGLC